MFLSISLMRMNNQLKLLIYICAVGIIFYLVQSKLDIFDISFESNSPRQSTEVEENQESIGDYVEIYNKDGDVIRVNVDIADEEYERNTGLSGRKYLGDYDGMLFIMEQQKISAFWMKDMYFNLDIIFIDTDGFIVDIIENIEPCEADFCPNIYSSASFKYVIEVKGGFANMNGIIVGNSIVINRSN